MLPATMVFKPAALQISPTKVVTVVLPFDPVIAITLAFLGRCCANNSISPITLIPCLIAACTAGSCNETPGLITINSAASNVAASKTPVCTLISGMRFITLSTSGGFSRESATDNKAPWLLSQCKADKPVSPRPSTSTFLSFKVNFMCKFFFVCHLSFKFVSYLSFKVDKPTKTSIMVMIQNRTTTCVSFQPFCSK